MHELPAQFILAFIYGLLPILDGVIKPGSIDDGGFLDEGIEGLTAGGLLHFLLNPCRTGLPLTHAKSSGTKSLADAPACSCIYKSTDK